MLIIFGVQKVNSQTSSNSHLCITTLYFLSIIERFNCRVLEWFFQLRKEDFLNQTVKIDCNIITKTKQQWLNLPGLYFFRPLPLSAFPASVFSAQWLWLCVSMLWTPRIAERKVEHIQSSYMSNRDDYSSFMVPVSHYFLVKRDSVSQRSVITPPSPPQSKTFPPL